jgi:AcrR family transcriptional regulator
MAKKTPIETREKLVQAAATLVIANGIHRVTLEQVALQAGVSKGGLLHHFPTKQALLSGLMAQLGVVFKARLERYMNLETPGGPGRLARAYIRASFEYDTDELQLTNAIAQVIGEFPELLAELQQIWTARCTQTACPRLEPPSSGSPVTGCGFRN